MKATRARAVAGGFEVANDDNDYDERPHRALLTYERLEANWQWPTAIDDNDASVRSVHPAIGSSASVIGKWCANIPAGLMTRLG